MYADLKTYKFKLPGKQPRKPGRDELDFHSFPLHEMLSDDFKTKGGSYIDKCRSMYANNEFPPCYMEHPTVQEYGESEVVVPLAFFADGAPYSLHDGVIGFWAVNMITSARYLILTLRKKTTCKCGCRGWCSYFEIFRHLRWMVEALQRKIWPSSRHDGGDWCSGDDDERKAMFGYDLCCRFACIFQKGDMMEFASTFGFASHNDGLRPCYRCNAQPSALHDLIGFGLAGFPARENRPEDLEAACDRCEHKVLLDGPSHAKLVAPGVLEYDKRERGKRGLVVVRDPNCLGIKPGMRVEPCDGLPNIGKYFCSSLSL